MVAEVVLNTRTVKLYVSVAVGVPLSTPEVDKEVPAGRVPDSNEYPVERAFVATRYKEYDTFCDVFARLAPVVHVGIVATICVNVRSENKPWDIVARIVKIAVSSDVAVPESSPVL